MENEGGMCYNKINPKLKRVSGKVYYIAHPELQKGWKRMQKSKKFFAAALAVSALLGGVSAARRCQRAGSRSAEFEEPGSTAVGH